MSNLCLQKPIISRVWWVPATFQWFRFSSPPNLPKQYKWLPSLKPEALSEAAPTSETRGKKTKIERTYTPQKKTSKKIFKMSPPSDFKIRARGIHINMYIINSLNSCYLQNMSRLFEPFKLDALINRHSFNHKQYIFSNGHITIAQELGKNRKMSFASISTNYPLAI